MSELSQRPRILMVGGADFTPALVCRFARQLNQDRAYELSALGVAEPSGRAIDEDTSQVFVASWPFPSPDFSQRNLGAALRFFADLWLAPHPPAAVRGSNGGVKSWMAQRIAWNYCARELQAIVKGYDLYHWHCFDPERLPMLRFFPDTAKLLISLWGSDLYRTAGIEEYRRQMEAIQRATLLTVGSLEMRETFLAKFGREWHDKIRIVNYGADNLALVDAARGHRDLFLRNIGVSPDRTVICIGNNASRINRHLDVLGSITTALPPDGLRQLAVVLPMTYGQEPGYLAAVKAAVAEKPMIQVIVLDRYLSASDAGKLRVSCDITVHVPVSDQFSAAMCEALYAGSILVTGAWLPYSRLRLNRVQYHEIASPRDAGKEIKAILLQLLAEKQRAALAAPIIRDLMSWDQVVGGWKAVYHELLS